MLTKNTKIILKILKKSNNKTCTYRELEKQTKWDYNEVKSACNQLIESGLATETFHAPVPYAGQIPWEVVLTEEGRNTKKYFWAKISISFVKTVLIPIAVAVITSIITTIITTYILNR